MGNRTLADFRRRLNVALGDFLQFDEPLDDWIQDANLELPLLADILAKKESATAVTVAGQAEYTLPLNLYAITALKDVTNDERITKMTWENYQLLDSSEEGNPTRYARKASTFFLHPTPDSVLTMRVSYIKEPDALTADADVTEFPAVYDRAIHLLALRNALMDLRQTESATFYYQVAQNYLRAIDSEQNYEAHDVSEPMRVPRSHEDLRHD